MFVYRVKTKQYENTFGLPLAYSEILELGVN